ncbi:MAG: hydroxymethylbilane synthase [Coriobacteriia bacterium]|nr:hydroxymethylbilane synthase [Coriobacteriia bacterium]
MRLSRTHFVVGTRGSKLALEQAKYIAARIRNIRPNLEVEVKVVETSGDKMKDVALAKFGGKSLFTKELDQKLLDYHIDIAVHSAKDVPADLDEDLMIAATPVREDVRDAMILREGSSLDDIPEGALIGTSSLRRRAQLLRLRPDLKVVALRGNIETRISRVLDDKKVDGIILATAGLNRLGLRDKISFHFDPNQMITAAGQGAIAVVSRKEDFYTRDIVNELSLKNTFDSVAAERMVMAELGANCQAPIGVFARLMPTEPPVMRIDAFVSNLDGSKMIKLEHSGMARDYEKVAKELVQSLKDAGAEEVLSNAAKEYESMTDEVIS